MSTEWGSFHDKTMPCPDFLMLNWGLGGIGFLEFATTEDGGGGGGGGKGAGWRSTLLVLITLLGDTGDCSRTWPALNVDCGSEVICDPFGIFGKIPFGDPVNNITRLTEVSNCTVVAWWNDYFEFMKIKHIWSYPDMEK